MSIEKPYTIFSEHIADLNKEIQRTYSLLRALEMQRNMLVKQDTQYRDYLMAQDPQPQPPYIALEQ